MINESIKQLEKEQKQFINFLCSFSCMTQYYNQLFVINYLLKIMQQSQSLSKNNLRLEQIQQLTYIDQEENTFIQLVLSGFSQAISLQQVKKKMLEEYPFIPFIQIINQNSLVCFFQSMTDLIEIDEGKKYGAIKSSIKNFVNIDNQKQFLKRKQSLSLSAIIAEGQEQHQYSLSTLQMKSFRQIPSPYSLKEKENNQSDIFEAPKLERLTSLEDELKQIQKLHNHFNVFKSVEQIDAQKIFNLNQSRKTRKLSQSSTQQNSKINLSDYKQQNSETQNKNQQKKQCGIVKPFVEGVLFTTFIWGGIKLAKFILKNS